MSRNGLDQENMGGVVTSERADTAISIPLTCRQLSTRAGITVAHQSIDFLKITLVTTALMARWLHQLFLELNRYDLEPAKEVQQTWLGLPIVGIAVLLSVTAKILNYTLGEKKYVDYLHALFSSSLIYYGLDVISNEGTIGSMPLGWFVATSAIFLPLTIAFFFKWTMPDSDHELICSLTDLNELNPPRYPLASLNERRINMITALKYGVPSITTLSWSINREMHGGTVGLPTWQKVFIAMYALIAAKIGFELTEHPKFFQGFVALSKALKYGSLSYASMSGIFYMMIIYQCDNRKFCINDNAQTILTWSCFIIALTIALYAAASARFQFEKNHQVNENLIASIKEKKTTAVEGCGAMFQKAGSGLSNCFHFFKQKVSDCCHRDASARSSEAEVLIATN